MRAALIGTFLCSGAHRSITDDRIREISLGIPDEKGRVRILEVMSKKMKLAGDFDMKAIARMTPGFVGVRLCAA